MVAVIFQVASTTTMWRWLKSAHRGARVSECPGLSALRAYRQQTLPTHRAHAVKCQAGDSQTVSIHMTKFVTIYLYILLKNPSKGSSQDKAIRVQGIITFSYLFCVCLFIGETRGGASQTHYSTPYGCLLRPTGIRWYIVFLQSLQHS